MQRLRLALVFLLVVVLAGACARPLAIAEGASVAAAPRASAPRAELRAGTSGAYAPLSVWTTAEPDGFAPELLRAFAAAERVPLRWSRFRWPDLTDDLRAARFDVAADGITVRPERSIAGRFTVPFARGGAVLLFRRPAWAAAAAGLRDLDRPALRVVVNQGGHLERVARSELRGASIRAIPDNLAVREAFARGEADAAVTNTFEAPGWASGLAGVERLGPLTDDVTALWVRADRADLEAQLDAWLLAEDDAGRLGALRAKWFGEDGASAVAAPVRALLAATSERLALMPYVAAAKRRAGKPVEDVAQEERVLAASAEAVAKAAAVRGVAPPARPLIDAFFGAQIQAAKEVQERASPADALATFELDAELRPAIARISSRMAMLVARLPRGVARDAVVREARRDLQSSGVTPESVERIATAIAALGGP